MTNNLCLVTRNCRQDTKGNCNGKTFAFLSAYLVYLRRVLLEVRVILFRWLIAGSAHSEALIRTARYKTLYTYMEYDHKISMKGIAVY